MGLCTDKTLTFCGTCIFTLVKLHISTIFTNLFQFTETYKHYCLQLSFDMHNLKHTLGALYHRFQNITDNCFYVILEKIYVNQITLSHDLIN